MGVCIISKDVAENKTDTAGKYPSNVMKIPNSGIFNTIGLKDYNTIARGQAMSRTI